MVLDIFWKKSFKNKVTDLDWVMLYEYGEHDCNEATNIWPKLIWRGYDHAETKIKDIDRQLQFVNILKYLCFLAGVWLYHKSLKIIMTLK